MARVQVSPGCLNESSRFQDKMLCVDIYVYFRVLHMNTKATVERGQFGVCSAGLDSYSTY